MWYTSMPLLRMLLRKCLLCLCVWVWVCIHVCSRAWASDIFLYHAPPCLSRQGLSNNSRIWLGSLANKLRGSPYLWPSALVLQTLAIKAVFSRGCWGSKVGTLLAEPSSPCWFWDSYHQAQGLAHTCITIMVQIWRTRKNQLYVFHSLS